MIESRLWDYDVWSADDSFCQGVVSITPEELQHIRDGAFSGEKVSESGLYFTALDRWVPIDVD